MKKTPINKVGKKTKERQRNKRKLIEELKSNPKYNVQGQRVYGVCPDCGKYKLLNWDHIKKRSLGGTDDKSNIAWICWGCHWEKDSGMKKSNKKKKKKTVPDICPKCKYQTGRLFNCPNCGKSLI